MGGKNIIFDDEKINKSNFYRNKRPFKIDDIDVNEILVSKREPYGKKSSVKYFIGYYDHDYFGPLCIQVPQMIGYVKHFDSNKTMSFKVIDNKILKQKVSFMLTYAYLESLLEKMSTCHPIKSSTTKINKHTPSGYSLFTHCSFDATRNTLDCYRGKDCIERFCKDLKEHATKIINYEKKYDTINL